MTKFQMTEFPFFTPLAVEQIIEKRGNSKWGEGDKAAEIEFVEGQPKQTLTNMHLFTVNRDDSDYFQLFFRQENSSKTLPVLPLGHARSYFTLYGCGVWLSKKPAIVGWIPNHFHYIPTEGMTRNLDWRIREKPKTLEPLFELCAILDQIKYKIATVEEPHLYQGLDENLYDGAGKLRKDVHVVLQNLGKKLEHNKANKQMPILASQGRALKDRTNNSKKATNLDGKRAGRRTSTANDMQLSENDATVVPATPAPAQT